MIRFGEVVADAQYGTSQKANEQRRGLPILRMNNLDSRGRLNLSDLKYVELASGDVERFSLRRGDLLFNRTNSPDLVGKMAVWDRDEPFALAGYLVRVRLVLDRADPRFIAAWFNTPEMKAELRVRAKPSINMSNISASELLKFHVPLPPLPEQRRIAEVLDRAEALRAKRRAALAKLDTLTQSIFLDMFGDPRTASRRWPRRQLRDVVAEFRYGTSNKSAADGMPTLRIPNVVNGSIDTTDLKLVPVNQTEFERLQLREGDLLFVRSNGNPDLVGRCAVVHTNALRRRGTEPDGFIFASYLIRARPRFDLVRSAYLRELLAGEEGRRQLRRRSKTSAGQYNLNTTGLGGIPILLPPLSLQAEFEGKITAVEALKSTQRASLAKLDALFASLQHRAFRGEL